MQPVRQITQSEASRKGCKSSVQDARESQRPWLLPPFWTGLEMPLTPGDKPLMAYQKWLEELGIVTQI